MALYLRVSTAEQSHEPQRQELLGYAARKWPVGAEVVEYVDLISGAKFTRVGLDGLMTAVRKGEIDVVLCVKLDRLGRSLAHLAQLIGELDKAKVALICSSQSIDTSQDNPAGRLQMHVLMAVAEFERSLIRERTKAGMVAAKARGAKIGRQPLAATVVGKVRGMLGKASLRVIARECGVSLGTVASLAKALRPVDGSALPEAHE